MLERGNGAILITHGFSDVLADCYWDMYARRDRVEHIHPEAPAIGLT
jgi:hypothetical protein